MSEIAQSSPEPTPPVATEPLAPATVSVQVSPGGLGARLKVDKGGSLDREALDAALERAGVVHGVNEKLADTICGRILETDATYAIAKGTHPQPQLPQRLKLEFNPNLEAGTKRADGTVDFTSRGALTPMQEGALVATELPEQAGKNGRTVGGEDIPFEKDASKQKWTLGNNVTREDSGKIVANIAGVISYEEGGKLDVVQHHEHRNPVDMRSGNLHTEGSLTVTADVERNFYVHATRDVDIRGGVVGGAAYAGNQIVIARGAVAGETGQIIAGGDIFLGHGQEAIIKTQGILTVERDLVNSDVHAQQVFVKNAIMGGLVMAETLIEVKQAGGRGRTRTVLAVATPIPPDFEVPDVATINETRARRSGRQHSRSVQVGRAMAVKSQGAARTDEEREARRALKAREKELRPKAKIRVTGTVSPGVIIRFGRLQYPIEREMASMEFSYDLETKKMVRVPIAP